MTIEPGCIYRPNPALVPHPSPHRVVVLAVKASTSNGEVLVRYTHHARGTPGESLTATVADFAARWTPDRCP